MKDYGKTDLSVCDPYSKVTCLVLQLYSMELGSPALYAEANRVAREMDFTLLKELGPFLQALFRITHWGEYKKNTDDKIETGEMIRDNYGTKYDKMDNMCGAFLLWRGAAMKEEWIE